MIEENLSPETPEALVEHPDGWYWVAPDGHQQFGPFESATAARADRDRNSENSNGQALVEAEEAMELNAWIDPQTGEPAEGPAPPHLDTEEGPPEI